MSDGSKIIDTTINAVMPLSYQNPVLYITGDNCVINKCDIRHDGAWNAGNVGLISLATLGNTIIKRCELSTTSPDAAALPSVYEHTAGAPYDLILCSIDGCAEPSDVGNNRLAGNVVL